MLSFCKLAKLKFTDKLRGSFLAANRNSSYQELEEAHIRLQVNDHRYRYLQNGKLLANVRPSLVGPMEKSEAMVGDQWWCLGPKATNTGAHMTFSFRNNIAFCR